MKNEYVSYYTIKTGDTLYGIARMFNVNPKLVAELNGINMEDYVYPGMNLILPVKGVQYYITKDNDTLKTVGNIFNANESELTSQNKSIYLLPGQMIFYKNN